jgi:SAM-dependent methyltransferase
MLIRALPLSEFVVRQECPACHATAGRVVSTRTGFSMAEQFPRGRVVPSEEVLERRRLLSCRECGLWYFDLVASPELVMHLLDQPGLVERWDQGVDRPAFQRARAVLARRAPGRILDVGAHSGGFLDTLPDGWSRTALEPMQSSSGGIEGTRVLNGFLEQVDLGVEDYDAISAFDVFEHLSDPDLAVGRIARALVPGGVAIVETGCVDALAARVLRGGWYYINFLEHFQAFSRRSLEGLFRRHGLEVATARRVFHSPVGLPLRLRSLGSASVFALVSRFGSDPRHWHALNRMVRPGHVGMPPSTIGVEPDHLFMVARKPA